LGPVAARAIYLVPEVFRRCQELPCGNDVLTTHLVRIARRDGNCSATVSGPLFDFCSWGAVDWGACAGQAPLETFLLHSPFARDSLHRKPDGHITPDWHVVIIAQLNELTESFFDLLSEFDGNFQSRIVLAATPI